MPTTDSINEGDASKIVGVGPTYGKEQLLAGLTRSTTNTGHGSHEIIDPEAGADPPANEEEVKEVLSKPPPVHSDYIPLPWKGRLGYVSSPCHNAFIRGTSL